MDIVHHARKGSSAVQRVIFVWSIRDHEHLGWISKLLTSALVSAPSSLVVDPRIYITGSKGQVAELKTLEYDSSSEPSSPSSASEEGKKAEVLSFTAFKTRRGRPEVDRIIQDAVSTAAGPVSVDVAGPSGLAQSVRIALKSEITSPVAILKGRPTVTLHVETFGMVKG